MSARTEYMSVSPSELAKFKDNIYLRMLPNTYFTGMIGCITYDPPGKSHFGFKDEQLVRNFRVETIHDSGNRNDSRYFEVPDDSRFQSLGIVIGIVTGFTIYRVGIARVN